MAQHPFRGWRVWGGPFLMVWLSVCGSIGFASDLAVRLFPDPALEAAVRSQVYAKRFNLEPLDETDVARVSSVIAHGAGIRSLVGLEKCANLALVELPGNQIVDLGPLSKLTKLQYLDVRTNQIATAVPLASVVSLQYLNLGWNRVDDASPLRGLTNLTALFLSGNRLADLSPVFGLAQLASLYADDNRIASIEGIGRMKGLTTLSLSGNRISNVRPIEGFESLQYLFLARNRLEDLADLVRWLEGDRDQRFAPFVQVDLAENPLGTEARRRQWKALKATGARLLP